MSEVKSVCGLCQNFITHPLVMVGDAIECPHCHRTTLLDTPADRAAKPVSIPPPDVGPADAPESHEDQSTVAGPQEEHSPFLQYALSGVFLLASAAVAARYGGHDPVTSVFIFLLALIVSLGAAAGFWAVFSKHPASAAGLILVFAGAAIAVYYFAIFSVDAPGTQTVNLSLLSDRQNGIILGSVLTLIGTILLAADHMKASRTK